MAGKSAARARKACLWDREVGTSGIWRVARRALGRIPAGRSPVSLARAVAEGTVGWPAHSAQGPTDAESRANKNHPGARPTATLRMPKSQRTAGAAATSAIAQHRQGQDLAG